MTSNEALVPIAGSEHPRLAGATGSKITDRNQRLEVAIVLRCGAGQRPAGIAGPPAKRLSAGQARRACTARGDDLARVQQFVRDNGLKLVTPNDASGRTVVAQGSFSELERAFGVELCDFRLDSGSHRGPSGPIQVPPALRGIVEHVFGLDDVPLASRRPHHGGSEHRKYKFGPQTLAKIYRFPPATGKGQRIGIIALGGGYAESDLRQYFRSIKVSPMPAITVDGDNKPADPSAVAAYLTGKAKAGPGVLETLEITQDVELVGAFAPGAEIVVYFVADDGAKAFFDLLERILFDDDAPDVLSMSYAFYEKACAPVLLRLIDGLLGWFAHRGVTFCASSGDWGSNPHDKDPMALEVMFPASSPHVLACGGTTLKSAGDETVWNAEFELMGEVLASGGGLSSVFDAPSWQGSLSLPKRGVPDVACVANPATGCRLLVAGVTLGSAGTSASAPIWAGLIARINELLGRSVGFLNPILYQKQVAATFRQITEGSNYRPGAAGATGPFVAEAGWNHCTGLGRPRGDALLAAIREVLAGG